MTRAATIKKPAEIDATDPAAVREPGVDAPERPMRPYRTRAEVERAFRAVDAIRPHGPDSYDPIEAIRKLRDE